MQQTTATTPSPSSSSFAALLAALSAPALKPEGNDDGPLPAGHRPAPAWNDDGLADNIATLSYERALRAHARYRSAAPPLPQPADPDPVQMEESFSSVSPDLLQATAPPIAKPEPEAKWHQATPIERNLKDASITIRMSKAECAQLHRRAAEAGLTVSAYLRSCTVEAESLRAMVKDTLGQLRSAKIPARPAEDVTAGGSRSGRQNRWLARLLPSWNGSRRVARA